MSNDEGRTLYLCDDICDRERLARACDAQKRLVALSSLQPFDEGRNSLRLVAGRLVVGLKFEGGHRHTVYQNRCKKNAPLFLAS